MIQCQKSNTSLHGNLTMPSATTICHLCRCTHITRPLLFQSSSHRFYFVLVIWVNTHMHSCTIRKYAIRSTQYVIREYVTSDIKNVLVFRMAWNFQKTLPTLPALQRASFYCKQLYIKGGSKTTSSSRLSVFWTCPTPRIALIYLGKCYYVARKMKC